MPGNGKMIRINKQKNEVLLSLNENIYDKKSIEKAVNDYKEICSVRKAGKDIILIPKKGIDIDKLGYEFFNYVLAVMKN